MGEIALLTVTTNDSQYTLIQQHEEWYLEGQEAESIDQQQVTLFVSRVVDLPAELPVSEINDEPDRYGLTSPTIEIAGIDQKRAGLADTWYWEHVRKAWSTLTGAGLPGIYQTRSLILGQIPTPETLLGQ